MNPKIIFLLILTLYITGAFGQTHSQESKVEKLFNIKQSNIKHTKQIKNSSIDSHAVKQKLDSLIIENMVKCFIRYNEHHQAIEDLYLYYNDEMDSWLNERNTKYDYDDDGNIISEIVYYWDFENNGVNEWTVFNKTEYEYNPNGTVAVQINSHWRYFYGVTEFGYASKNMYEYDKHKNEILNIYYENEGSINEPTWIENGRYKTDYVYDDNYNVLVATEYYQIHSGGEWAEWLDAKREFKYNEDNKPISIKYYIWEDDSHFLLEEAQILTWDDYGNLLSDERHYTDWKSPTELIPEEKYVYDYDMAYTNNEITFPNIIFVDDLVFNNMPISMSLNEWDYLSGEWENFYNGTFYYSPVSVEAINDHNDMTTAVRVYPNPIIDKITIELPDNITEAFFRLFDFNGRIVISKTITSLSHISANSLPSGIYYYSIYSADIQQIGKLIKR